MEKNDFRAVFFALIFLIAILSLISSIGTSKGLSAEAPRRLDTARPDACKACHGNAKVLPADHPSAEGMTYEICAGCHKQNLCGKLPLSHVHLLSGVNCRNCHGETQPAKAPAWEKCLHCHAGRIGKLAAKTERMEVNPHSSPHGVIAQNCNVCHHQHRKSENYCAKCHDFEFKVCQ